MTYYCFDFYGRYLGYMDGKGEFYDSRGGRWARLVDGRKVYDLGGLYQGYIDAQGSFFNADGVCRGYLRGWTDLPMAPPPRAGSEALFSACPA